MEKKDYNYNMFDNPDERSWADMQFLYHTDLFFATKEGFETFKREVCDEEGNVDFNKYIPCDPKNPSEVLDSWGSFEAHHCTIDEENIIISFCSFLNVPSAFIETWSKNHPNLGLCALYAYDNNRVDEKCYICIYKGGLVDSSWYSQNFISEEEYQKDIDAAWDRFLKEYWNTQIYPICYETLKKFCPEIEL